MPLPRLFLAEAELHLRTKGLARSARWFSAASPLSCSKEGIKPSNNTEAEKEKKADAIKSFVSRYMMTHSGVFPKANEVHDEVGGSWYILRDVLAEIKPKMLPDSITYEQFVTESHVISVQTSEATDMKENTDRCKLDRAETGFHTVTEISGAAESRLTSSADPAVLATVEVPENFELLGPKCIQCLDNKRIEEEETTSSSTTEVFSSEAKFGIAGNGRGNNPTHGYCSAPSHDTLAVDNGASEKNISLVEVFKRNAGKVELNRTKIKASKQVTCLDLKKDKCFISLDTFEKNQKDIRDDSISADNLEEKMFLNSSEACGLQSERSSLVKGLVDCIVELSKDTSKTPLWANGQYDKTDRTNTELIAGVTRGSAHEELNLVSANEESKFCDLNECMSEDQFEKTEGKRASADIEKKYPKEVNISSFLAGSRREQENDFIGSGSRKENLQLVKKEMAMESPFGSGYQFMNDDSDSDIAAFDYPKVELGDEVPLTTGVKLNTSSCEEICRHKNSLLLKFLPKTVKVNELALSFADCGSIAEIRIVPSRKENKFNYAYIYFKTEEGLRKALSKSDMAVGGADIVLEPISPTMTCNSLFTMGPVMNEDFPAYFLKNPSRTVVIKDVPDDLSFHHVRRALARWGQVSAFALGSMSCDVYVEFESEESKEHALSEAVVSVSGRKLSILRVDTPNTTVVRILNVNPHSGGAKVRSICDSFGRVKRLVGRDIDTVDVHFKLSEWPNMVKILNRINGLVVDQHQWIAQPATIFPVEVLQAIWSKPEGRKLVHEMIQDLCRRIEKKRIDTAPMISLTQQYYGES